MCHQLVRCKSIDQTVAKQAEETTMPSNSAVWENCVTKIACCMLETLFLKLEVTNLVEG